MTDMLLIIIIGLLCIAIYLQMRNYIQKNVKPAPTQKKHTYTINNPLNVDEMNLLKVLQTVTPNESIIMPKVQLGQFIGSGQIEYRQNFNTALEGLYVDFLITSKAARPILVIELLDYQFEKKRKRQAQSFISQVCNTAGINIITIKPESKYDPEKIKNMVENAFNKGSGIGYAKPPL